MAQLEMLRKTANEIRRKLVTGCTKCSVIDVEWKHNEVIVEVCSMSLAHLYGHCLLPIPIS